MLRKLTLAAGGFLLLCALVPVFYGVFNIGNIVLLGGCALLFLLFLAWRRIARRRWLRRTLSIVLGLGMFCCGSVSLLMLKQAFFTRPPADEPVNVVVLGAKAIGSQPSTVLRHRLNAAAKYLEKNPQAVCIVSGGQGDDEEYPEAQVMAWYLEAQGVDPARVIQEDRSTNTLENIAYSIPLMNADYPVAIVTDSFHQLRASMHAREAGLVPYGVSSFTPPGLLPCYWARDMFGVMLTWLEQQGYSVRPFLAQTPI